MWNNTSSTFNQSSDWTIVTHALDSTIGYSMIITGLIGLVGTILMLITFLQKSMSATGYSYYRAISSLELIHMVVLVEYGVIRVLHFPPSRAMEIWNLAFAYGWSFGDWIKLSVASLTVFVSLERTMAIWTPMTFAALVDHRRSAYTAIGISLALGAVHGFTFVLYETDPGGPSYQSVFAQVQNAIGYLKLSLCALLAALTLSVLLGLRIKAKKLAKMKNKTHSSTSSSEREKWRTTKLRCYLQLILACSTLVDHAAWFSYRMLALKVDQSMDQDGRVDFGYKKLMDCVEVVQVLTGEILHCGKFYLYFLLHSGFRSSFYKVFITNKIGK